ncbi:MULTISPECIES: hypothetical protein [Fusobacterium]|mgnify:FL=1|jgi:hypothetical protein|uniref:hypothetical protein n=1 Tax=Fusobacterium TaxID=848 RepID=UPI000E8CECC1|nr:MULTISPECIES: hypothetical protein [Fusobacterium]HBJ78628.1 hypothetical protein [Fusobacterium sp.]
MNFFLIIFVILFMILGNFFIVFLNTRIVMKNKRTKCLENLSKEKGYNFTKRWDCNYSTIAIDEEKKVVVLLQPAFLDFKALKINADNIAKKKIIINSLIPGMVTRVGISLTLKNNEECELDTLSLKKVLFGTFKFHPVVTKAIKNAEEIESILNLF